MLLLQWIVILEEPEKTLKEYTPYLLNISIFNWSQNLEFQYLANIYEMPFWKQPINIFCNGKHSNGSHFL